MEPAEETSAHIIYKVEYVDDKSDVVYTKESKDSTVVESILESAGHAALEVITRVRIAASNEGSTGIEPASLLGVDKTSLKINSPAIIAALRSVVGYYPGQNFSDKSIIVDKPFAVLVHHREALKDYRAKFAPGGDQAGKDVCKRNQNAFSHLGLLEDFLEARTGASVAAERARHKRGFATFDMLWLLFQPGRDIYVRNRFNGSLQSRVMHSATVGNEKRKHEPFTLYYWNLDYDGHTIGRSFFNGYDMDPYEGERAITELFCFPCDYWKDNTTDETVKPLRNRLEDRGRMFFRLTSRQCMNYDGYTDTFPKTRVSGMVVVDPEEYFLNVKPEVKPTLSDINDDISWSSFDCVCHVCSKTNSNENQSKKFNFAEYNHIAPETTKELTPHQYFLCGSSVHSFVLKDRSWRELDLYDFREPVFDTKMIDTLVIAEDRRQLIKALAKNYSKQDESGQQIPYKPWAADFVEGKGEGKIFLLHGKPGVGKTFTAECIAHYTQRPLLSLTISDIGTDPSVVEYNLKTHFERAKLWDAIMLIDEADIYMERRETSDLTRNSLVSGFLRAMEYCQSILFLTTNRVGSFDDAFVSRIHVSLYYPDFSEEDRRKVWKVFFEKLRRDRGDIMRVPIETKDYTNGQEVKSLKWNGREIRNAFQTAVALADFEGDKDEEGKVLLKDTHIMQIVRMSGEFKNYLGELHQGNESKRAERQRIRLDDFSARD